mgnify:CR=1 FL=1
MRRLRVILTCIPTCFANGFCRSRPTRETPFQVPDWRVQACESGDFTPSQPTEFWQFGQKGAGDDGSDAWDAAQQVFGLAPGRSAPDLLVDFTVEFGQFLFKRQNQAGDGTPCPGLGKALLTLPFGGDHLNDLTASGDQIGPQLDCGIRQGPRLWACGLNETGNDFGIDWIGFRPAAPGPWQKTGPEPDSPPPLADWFLPNRRPPPFRNRLSPRCR